MISQDSTHPTGVANDQGDHHDSHARASARTARQRKSDAAVAMRIAGATWAEIAQTLGYPTPRQALVNTERALARQLATEESRDQMRRMAGARLERLLRSVWTKAVNIEHPEHLMAVGKAREIVDRHIKLFGLDAPTEIVVHNPTSMEIEMWVARVMESAAPTAVEYDIITGEVVEGTG